MISPSDPKVPDGAANPSRPPVAGMLRRVVTGLIFGYTIALILLFLSMEISGERCWPLAVLLYLPQRIFLLPLIILVPAALLAEVPLGAYAALVGSVIIYFWHVPFFPGIAGSPSLVQLKLISNNYGTNHNLPVQPFIDAENPDITVLEDASGQAPKFQHSYPRRTVLARGQFICISQLPVKSGALLDWPRWRGEPVAAVWAVEWQGQEIAIYSVHLPTPRGDFATLAHLGVGSFADAMTARVQLARDLAGVLSRESRPCVALGDFNMPSDGYVHRVMTAGLTDCFVKVGAGFGFTFPCDTSNPLTLGGPWLRLDYILAGPGWHIEDFRVEPSRRSQHRAVMATMDRG
jgi:endonuclease/exonuclease/phosphatase family metal-dependent hydrolase